jgi:hypothetical protein
MLNREKAKAAAAYRHSPDDVGDMRVGRQHRQQRHPRRDRTESEADR